MKSICLFAGSNVGRRPEYAAGAAALGTALGERGIKLVYGGGSIGLMGVAADAALAAGGRVEGVIPRGLASKERMHEHISRMHLVGSMHSRKQMMHDLSDGFIAAPGGLGTLEEITELTTWAQLGIHQKPVGLLNLEGFFDVWLHALDHFVDEQMLAPEHRSLLLVSSNPDELLDEMAAYEPNHRVIWLDENET